MNILLIDDDEEDALLFNDAVKEVAPHLTCYSFNNAFNAIEHLMEENTPAPTYIFIDMYMYPLNGKESLSRLKQMTKLAASKFIIHAGTLSPAQQKEFTSIGADRIILKAGDYHDFCSTLRSILMA